MSLIQTESPIYVILCVLCFHFFCLTFIILHSLKYSSCTYIHFSRPLSIQKRFFFFLFQIQYNLNGSNPNGSFTQDDSYSFFSPYKILPIAQENKYIGFFLFFLSYYGIVCCVYSFESPHRGDSNEYIQHTIIV